MHNYSISTIKLIVVKLLLFFGFVLFSGTIRAARPVAVVPFELSGSYVVVKASINGSAPLSFIFDTGVRNTIITHLDADDQVLLTTSRSVPVFGLGSGVEAMGLVSEHNTLGVGKLSFTNRVVMVLEEDVLQLSELNGRKINGLLGVDVMQGHVVEVNYSRRKILFYDSASYQVPANYHSRELLVENNKLYLPMTLFDSSMKLRRIKMFIDTGALLNAWFLTVTNNVDEIKGPKIYARIGSGFNGEVNGYLAHIPRICLGDYCFDRPIVAFPDSAVIAEVIRRSDRDGTIGSELLARFNLVFDLHRRQIHFRPNSYFKLPFVYNVAGIELIQSQPPLPGYEITAVWRDSPAERAGVLPGDQLIGINNETVFTLNLSAIRGIFQKPSRRPMQLLLMRNGTRVEVEVDMRERL
jgi:hypothetical protein